jgi:predicted flap endonuclease-1-like 5' DNA nuclease
MAKAKTNSKAKRPASDLPAGLAAPAQRALARAGVTRLAQLAKMTEAEVKALHGIGPNALAKLRAAMAAKELAFAGEK